MSRIKNFFGYIKQAAQKLLFKSGTPLAPLHRNIPYINKPITDTDADEIGMDVYVDYLESAIEQGASMISVVSRFGTGKSSLIELLKKKYSGFEKKGNIRTKRLYCQVNLWSHLGKIRQHEDGHNGTPELHRTFLYQMISALHPGKSSYFSKRTSRNFGMLRISTENPLWGAWIRIAVLFFLGALLGQQFSGELTGSGMIGKELLNQLIILGYAACAIIIVLVILRTEIIFSSKNSEGNRQIEENELIELYREHILVPRRWYRKLWARIVGVKQIVVIIEDLDRTDDGDSVYEFLKELRKYYVPYEQSEKNFMNQVVFVVNIMPEDLLQDKCKNTPEEQGYVYDKLFDYSLNLNRVNIDNFDAVLEALLMEKRAELEGMGLVVYDSDNTHRMPGMQWIVHGRELSLRQVKARLNDAVLLYESLRTKFGAEYPEFIKCAMVAYLRNTYSKDFYKLTDRELEEMLDWYARGLGDEKVFLEEFESTGKSQRFLKELYEMIVSHLIDGNYRIYFFNYPRDSHLYTVQETKVRNLIVYDEKVDADMEAQIGEVWAKNPKVITDALDTVQELAKTLPDAVTYSEIIWDAAIDRDYAAVYELLVERFSNVKEWDKARLQMIDRVCRYKEGPEFLSEAIAENEPNRVTEIRDYLLAHHREQMETFVELFRDGEPMTKEEFESTNEIPLETVLKMLPAELKSLPGEVVLGICDRVEHGNDRSALLAAEHFYEKMAEAYPIEDIAEQLTVYMHLRNALLPALEDDIYEGVTDERISSDIYYELLNQMPTGEIGEAQLERIHALNEPGHITPAICERFKEARRIGDYLQNQILLDENALDLPLDEAGAALRSGEENIWKRQPQLFLRIRAWMCGEYKDAVAAYSDLFRLPYPIITAKELRNISGIEVALKLYDREQMAEDEEGAFVLYCNRQYRPSREAFSIFKFIAGMDETVIGDIFYALDMKKVKFAGMSKERKKEIVKELQIPLNLTDAEAIVRFMDFTGCLMPELEREIAEELKEGDNEKLSQAYVAAINKMGKVTAETIKNILAMPKLYYFSDVINEELYARKHYTVYVSSRTRAKNAFAVEYERMDVLWQTYLAIMKSANGYMYTRPHMYRNKEFLKMIQDRGDYKGFPEESRMAMAGILQDEKNLEEALTYGEDFVIRYYSSIAGFQSKQAADKFVKIMKKYPQYAQNKQIYDAVHGKLIDGNLKRAYTNLYKRANGH